MHLIHQWYLVYKTVIKILVIILENKNFNTFNQKNARLAIKSQLNIRFSLIRLHKKIRQFYRYTVTQAMQLVQQPQEILRNMMGQNYKILHFRSSQSL